MNRFIEKYNGKLVGVINGFDRLVLKGTLRPLSYTAGMMNFLVEKEVLLKDFNSYVKEVSEQLKEASQQEAGRLGRPNRYLESSRTRKEPLARGIAKKEGIEEGLICLLRTVEPCMSYDI
jgi:predicted PolB exonuclease-like 3'-5' exonuclease